MSSQLRAHSIGGLPKARRIDLSPDNFIAGIAGQLSASELGVYWLMCLLFYSHGGSFDYDESRMCALLGGTHWRTVRSASERLQELGKINSERGQVTVKGCSGPLQEAIKRITRAVENGGKGGRPLNEINDLEKPDGLHSEKLARDALPPPSSPSPPSPKKESNNISFNGSGKNGNGKNGHVTIQSSTERIARFQQKLADGFIRDGIGTKEAWLIVGTAADSNLDGYETCLNLCKTQATKLKKGWPHNWPNGALS